MRLARLTLSFIILAVLTVITLGIAAYQQGYDGTDLRYAIVALYSSATWQPRATADDAALRFTVTNRLGVNAFLEQEVDPARRQLSLRMARDAGFHWVRQQFAWAALEPDQKGSFVGQYGESTWDVYDDIVSAAEEMGMELIVRLDTSPKWARLGNLHVTTPPDDLADFGDYVAAVVGRYRGRVRYYQVWNEPNLAVEWGNRPVDARAATELLRVGYQRARAADPDATVLAPALAPTIADGPDAVNELHFLQAMYDAGAAAYFDIGSVQAYGLRSGPDDRRLGAGDVNFSRPILYREVMVRNGDAAKPVWASEVAWNAPPADAPGPYPWGNVNPQQQARYTVRALQRARQEWPWMGVMNVWYLKPPDDREMGTVFAGFRLLDPDFTPRPVYRAIQAYAGPLR
jgi:polysaccharide biosynthesis protein PslG